MKLRIWRSLARGVVLESVRRKDLWVVAILGFLIICAAGALGFFGIHGLEAFAKDLGVTVVGLFSTIMAVLVSTRLLPDEIRQRTLYPLLARPISRFDLLVGKWFGAVIVTGIAFLLLCGLTAIALLSFRISFEPILAQYVVAKMLGLTVVCAVSIALGTYMTPQAAATVSLIFAFGSSMFVRGLLMAYDASNPVVAWVFKGVNAGLPQYSLFDLGGRAANIGWAPVPLWVMAFLFGYAAIYAVAMLGVSWLKFRRQAL